MKQSNQAEASREELIEELDSLRLRVKRLAHETARLEQTEDALRISEKVFRQIFDESPVGMHLITPSFDILRANAAFYRMLGFEADELNGRPLASILHPGDVAQGLELARQMRSGAIPGYEIEPRYLRRDGDTVWAKLSASVIRDSMGRFLYGIGVVENITEAKRAEAERARLQTQLHQSQKMEAVGRLSGAVAHDFNNILTVVLGNASLLKKSLENLDENQERRLEEILEASERASSLVRQLLTFSRTSAKKPERLDPNAAIRALEPVLARLIGEHIELVVTLHDDVGRVEIDRGQLQQVILNLSLNARDAMPRGGRLQITTHSALTPDGARVNLEFRDTGRGMTDDTRARAYEPFFTTKPPGEGTGLGLATVYAVVTEAGGTVHIESTVGRGTTVSVSLPATRRSE